MSRLAPASRRTFASRFATGLSALALEGTAAAQEAQGSLLSDCGCDEAAIQRRRIADAVTKLGSANPETEAAAYEKIVDDYVARFGSNAELAYVRRHAWLDPVLTLFAALAAVVLLITVVERWRRSRAEPVRTTKPRK